MDSPRRLPDVSLGAFVGQLRRQRGLSQQALAAQIGCDRTYVWRVEHAKRRPSRFWVRSLVVALALSDAEQTRLARLLEGV